MLPLPAARTPSATLPGGGLSRRDMICFCQDFTGDPLSKTHVMRLLARENRVLWVNSIGNRTPTLSKHDLSRVFAKLAALATPLKQVEPNLFVLNPFALPLFGRAAQMLNSRLLRFQIRRAMRALHFRRPISWVFNPAAAVVAGSLNEDRIVYYCVDEYPSFAGVNSEAMAQLERDLMRRADLVIVSAARLQETKSPHSRRTVLVRHGVNFHHFRKALSPQTNIPAEICDLPRPVIGYFGLISSDWFDVKLMEHAARAFPQGSVVLLGKVAMDVAPLQRLPNVHFLGRKPYDTLPAFCKGFDVSVIPFPVSEVTLNANPLKAREYLAAGLPVVSTPIPEVQVLGKCLIADTPDEFVRQIHAALAAPGPRPGRSETMRGESWEARLEEIAQHFASLS
jgi:glycosyltransferase involved in cell wall biosynthesis